MCVSTQTIVHHSVRLVGTCCTSVGEQWASCAAAQKYEQLWRRVHKRTVDQLGFQGSFQGAERSL